MMIFTVTDPATGKVSSIPMGKGWTPAKRSLYEAAAEKAGLTVKVETR